MLGDAFRRAAIPLFEAGAVDVLEYSFELGWARARPAWAEALLQHYGAAGRLWGHGVTYSTLSAGAPQRQSQWQRQVSQDCEALQLRGVSEHYGFMGVDGVDVGAPLPPPPTPEVVDVGVRALEALAQCSGVPVGLENLAMAFCRLDVEAQPEIVTRLLEAVDGYLVLDLHNLWCQAVNFRFAPLELLCRYPLSRARVLHVSGGSWSSHGGTRLRRDTHDDRVPDEVWSLLPEALSRCANLEVVILEQLGPTLASASAAEGYQADFHRLREVCA